MIELMKNSMTVHVHLAFSKVLAALLGCSFAKVFRARLKANRSIVGADYKSQDIDSRFEEHSGGCGLRCDELARRTSLQTVQGSDDVTAHIGTSMPSGGGRVISATVLRGSLLTNS